MTITNHLAVAELAIYAALSLPVLFLLIRHLPAGFLGWFFLFSFCTIRIVADAMTMNKISSSGNIVANVGLSPLLLAAGGILHEARAYRLQTVNKLLEWTLAIFFHFLVATGIALLAVGVSGLSSSDPTDNDQSLLDAGVALLVVAWAFLIVWVAATFFERNVSSSKASAAGKTLLISIAVALPFIGIRVIYSVVALTSQKPYLNPLTGSLAIRVVVAFLPELVAVLIFIAAGFLTFNAARNQKADSANTGQNRPVKY